MEQRLDATYLKHDPIDRAAATALVAAGLGIAVFFAAWGVSFLWRYTPSQIEVRQSAPFVVKQEAPFVMATPDPLKIDQEHLSIKVEQPPSLPMGDRLGPNSRTAAGDVIQWEVTKFSHVQHGVGTVVTGWNYRDGRGGTPVSQFCYYTTWNPDQSSRRVNLAANGVRLTHISVDIVPDLEGALSKCQWWPE
jgi:hypothetical protein